MTPVLPPGLRVAIAIPTFRRPDRLAALLADLPARIREVHDVARCEVVVVDNDPEGSARAAAEQARGLTVRYVVEPRPGIAAARNRALAESAALDLLAFIDDDERPRPGWLSHLVHTWLATRPAAVMGRVISLFGPDVDPWVLATGTFRRPPRPTGTELAVAATGNLLLDLRQVRERGLRFEPALGLAGGEDTLFSKHLVSRGGRIVWCNESEAEDEVQAGRTTRAWTMRRAFSGGNSAIVVRLWMAGGAAARLRVRTGGIAGGLLRAGGGYARHLAGRVLGNLDADARGLRTAYRGAGMVAASLGHVHQEYERTTAAARVLIAHPSADLYGSDLQMVETVRGLVGHGSPVTVAVPAAGPLVEHLERAGADVVVQPVPVLRKSALTPAGVVRLAYETARTLPGMVRLVRRLGARTVLVNTITIPSWTAAARLAGARTVTHVHEAETQQPRIVQAVLAAPLKAAHQVVANSAHTRAAMLAAAPFLDERRMHLVPNGVPGPAVEPSPPSAHAGPAQLLLLGRLSRRKGTLVAIEATGRLVQQGRDVHLTISGSVYEDNVAFEEEVAAAVAAWDLGERVTVLGYADRWQVLERADLVLVPSLVEPFGNVAVEAMLAARPVVASGVGGLAENITDGVDGVLVPPADAEALAAAAGSLLDDPELARRLATTARKTALERFDVQAYRRAMWELLAGPRARRR